MRRAGLAVLAVVLGTAFWAGIAVPFADEAFAVTTISSSVNHTCSQDVTGQVTGFAGGGGDKQLQPDGCYIVNAKMNVAGSLDGNGSEIRKTSQKDLSRNDNTNCKQHAGMVKMTSGSALKNITLRRLGPSGYNECHYAEHGIEIVGGDGVTLTNITEDKVWGDCLYLQGASNVYSKNLNCLENGRQGGAIARASNIHLDGFYVRNSDRSGFDFEANNTQDAISNVEIENFLINTDDDGISIPAEDPPTDYGKIAFPSQGYASPQNIINIHNGRITKALSVVYDRQQRPVTAGCAENRQNWKFEHIDVDPSIGTHANDPTPSLRDGYGYRSASGEAGGNATAIFCGTNNVTFNDVNMPGGYLTMEADRGDIQVTNSCFKGLTTLRQTVSITQSGNNTSDACDGTPPVDTVPGPPTIGTATAGNAQATVRFTPPADNGGQPVIDYKATATPGGRTATGTGSPLTVTGLTNGTVYTFKVTARNSIGTSTTSLASNAVTPMATATVPDPPVIGTATAGDASAVVHWTAPTNTGGQPINAYIVYRGSTTAQPVSYTDETVRQAQVNNLTNGTAYQFTVRAQNSVGISSASALSNTVTPTSGDTVPGAPTIGTATPGDGLAVVSFSPPASNGGRAIIDYTVVSTPGGVTATGTGSPVTVDGLTNGTSYTFKVKARNALGFSVLSGASNAVTPGSTPTEFQRFIDELRALASGAYGTSFAEFLADLQQLVDNYQ